MKNHHILAALFLLTSLDPCCLFAQDVPSNYRVDGFAIAAAHTLTSTTPPNHVPTDTMVDGPILGNGDLGVVLAGTPDNLQFFLGKNDFWSVRWGSPINVGRIAVHCARLTGGTWHTEQDMAQAELRGTFASTSGAQLSTRSFVDAHANRLVTTLHNNGSGELPLTVTPFKGQTTKDEVAAPAVFIYAPAEEPKGAEPERYGHLEGPILAPLPPQGAPKVAVATSQTGTISLKPGESVTLVTAVASNFDASDVRAQAVKLSMLDDASDVVRAHRQWWRDYWSRSFIEISDKLIEGAWVAGNYGMGSCSRPGKLAPGLWGNWITTDKPAWRSDYHLNYNFQAPYYGVFSNNHAELAEPFYRALTESLPEGREMAKRWRQKGILFPVSIGPWGWRPWGTEMTLGQKSDAAFAALLFIWNWQYLQDKAWLKSTGYPFLRETAEFWENYLTYEPGPDGKHRYVIHGDAIHEGSGDNINSLLSLGLVHTLFTNMIAMSETLGIDADKRTKWRDILDKLSQFPVQERDGKMVFRYTEKGPDWWRDNTLGIHHIFPAGAIHLGSEPQQLEISHHMLAMMGRWEDPNGSSSWYAACARTGYHPKETLDHLHQCIARHIMPNGLMAFRGGGIENFAAPMQITEFMLQSEGNVLRIFPCWPKDAGDARFGTLRAKGAFLVSAQSKDGKISGVEIHSEQGRDCTLANPWPNKKVTIARNGQTAETIDGIRLTLKTHAGERITLTPLQ